jgi:hypothetical protein
MKGPKSYVIGEADADDYLSLGLGLASGQPWCPRHFVVSAAKWIMEGTRSILSSVAPESSTSVRASVRELEGRLR